MIKVYEFSLRKSDVEVLFANNSDFTQNTNLYTQGLNFTSLKWSGSDKLPKFSNNLSHKDKAFISVWA